MFFTFCLGARFNCKLHLTELNLLFTDNKMRRRATTCDIGVHTKQNHCFIQCGLLNSIGITMTVTIAYLCDHDYVHLAHEGLILCCLPLTLNLMVIIWEGIMLNWAFIQMTNVLWQIQMCYSFYPKCVNSLHNATSVLEKCIPEVSQWMVMNKSQSNEGKIKSL